MTTIRDYLNDLVMVTLEKVQDKGGADNVTQDEINDLVDETASIIKDRIVG